MAEFVRGKDFVWVRLTLDSRILIETETWFLTMERFLESFHGSTSDFYELRNSKFVRKDRVIIIEDISEEDTNALTDDSTESSRKESSLAGSETKPERTVPITPYE